MNILVDSNIVLLPEILSEKFNVITYDGGELSNELIRETKSEILFVRSTTNCDVFLLGGTDVRFIGTATAGIDNLDIDFLEKNNIKWTNAAGSNAISVAEYVTLGIQKWTIENIINIEEKTLGIVGYGNIGYKVAKIFENYCQNILIYDPYVSQLKTKKSEFVDYHTLLSKADIITFHTPLTKSDNYPTYKMLDSDNLHLVNENILLINASRGGVVSEFALRAEKFNTNNLIFDVWENEPEIDSDFASKLFISTPHIAGHSYEGKLRGTLNMVQSFELYTGKRVDKSILINKINESRKYELNSLDYYDLFALLTN